ncbi:MAG: hypothetical protein GF414_00650 [Candidatus Altiarchaeales archaeon]|nr:hypothetical protein [Candidatus Altiarchaeales archaeon]
MLKIRFEFERETKNTVRFQEVENSAEAEKAVGTLYIQKSVLGDPYPKSVVVTVETEDDDA